MCSRWDREGDLGKIKGELNTRMTPAVVWKSKVLFFILWNLKGLSQASGTFLPSTKLIVPSIPCH